MLTVRKAVPRPRRAPRGSVSREASPVSRAWERGAPGCWSARTDCPRSWPLSPWSLNARRKTLRNSKRNGRTVHPASRRRRTIPEISVHHTRTSRTSHRYYPFFSFPHTHTTGVSIAIAVRERACARFPLTPRSAEYRVTVARASQRRDAKTHLKPRRGPCRMDT